MATTYNVVTVTSTATLIIAANSNRRGSIVLNLNGPIMYIGPNNLITTANAIPLEAKDIFSNAGDGEVYKGDIYGITETLNANVRYWEWTP